MDYLEVFISSSFPNCHSVILGVFWSSMVTLDKEHQRTWNSSQKKLFTTSNLSKQVKIILWVNRSEFCQCEIWRCIPSLLSNNNIVLAIFWTLSQKSMWGFWIIFNFELILNNSDPCYFWRLGTISWFPDEWIQV